MAGLHNQPTAGRVLLLESDAGSRRSLSQNLHDACYHVACVETLEEAFLLAIASRYETLVLDLSLGEPPWLASLPPGTRVVGLAAPDQALESRRLDGVLVRPCDGRALVGLLAAMQKARP